MVLNGNFVIPIDCRTEILKVFPGIPGTINGDREKEFPKARLGLHDQDLIGIHANVIRKDRGVGNGEELGGGDSLNHGQTLAFGQDMGWV